MTDAAVISGSLVDAKNVNTHKVMRLIIDVPAENALKVIAAFGWPTMVNPVSVAVARLNEHVSPRAGLLPVVEAAPRPAQPPASAGEDKPKKSPAQIAGYLCNTIPFQKFLKHKCPAYWAQAIGETSDKDHVDDWGAESAAHVVRAYCRVKSRSELTDRNADWSGLLLAFRLWENHPELEDA